MCAMMHCVTERKYIKDVRADAQNKKSISQPLKIRNPTQVDQQTPNKTSFSTSQ